VTNAILVAPRGRAARLRFTIRLRVPASLAALALAALALAALTVSDLMRVAPDNSVASGRPTLVTRQATPLPVALLRIPAAAQAPVSAALGRDDAAYRIAGMSITNPEQRLSAHFVTAGARIGTGAVRFTLGLTGVGRGTRVQPVAPVEPRVAGQVVRYDYRGSVSETWQNGPLGLEQVFVVTHRPSGAGALTFAMATPAGSRLDAGDVLLPGGLRYDGLRVSDARGRLLHSWLSIAGGSLLIKVSDRGAQYPLRVDPLVQQAYLTPSDGAVGDLVGNTVAVSGQTVVVSWPSREVGTVAGQGVLYVFSDASGKWTQTAELSNTNGTADQYLGTAVAVSGNTIVASAPNAGTDDQGALYVFNYGSGHWTQVAELTASDGAARAEMGDNPDSVAISGNEIVAGAEQPNGAVSGEGAVYVFDAGANGWQTETQSAELTEASGATDDYLGYSVAISGNTIAAGAPAPFPQFGHQSAIYVFTGSGSHWQQTAELSAKSIPDTTPVDALGYAVAISGDTIAAPEQGGNPLIVFQQSGGKWKQSADLTYHPICDLEECGGGGTSTSVAFSGDAILSPVGDTTADGKAYVVGIGAYREFAGKWRQVAATAAGNGTSSLYGAVAGSGSTVAAGVYNDTDAGAVAIFNGKVTAVGQLIAGPVGLAGTGVGIPVLCVLTSTCDVTLTGYRAGSQTVIGTGKTVKIKPGGTKAVDMAFTTAAERLLSTKHKLKAKLVVRAYSNGKLKASETTSITFT
jgi:trimeric autotransporter adhesin